MCLSGSWSCPLDGTWYLLGDMLPVVSVRQFQDGLTEGDMSPQWLSLPNWLLRCEEIWRIQCVHLHYFMRECLSQLLLSPFSPTTKHQLLRPSNMNSVTTALRNIQVSHNILGLL